MIRHLHRGLWLTAGLLFLALTAVGLLLPVVPQLPFLLAAVLCFMRCSRRFREWMERHHWFRRLHDRFGRWFRFLHPHH